MADRSSAEASRRELAICQAKLQASEERLQSAAAEGNQLRQEAEASRQRIANLEAERSSLLERLAEARQAHSQSETNKQQLIEKLLALEPPAQNKKTSEPGVQPESP